MNMRWILLGGAPDFNSTEFESLLCERRIVLREWEENLQAFYRICNVYLNPDRQGGGLSILLAMNAGLPVAVLNRLSDGLMHVGESNAIDGYYPELIRYLEQLYSDKKLYDEVSEKMKSRVSEVHSAEGLKKFTKAFQICYDCFWLQKSQSVKAENNGMISF